MIPQADRLSRKKWGLTNVSVTVIVTLTNVETEVRLYEAYKTRTALAGYERRSSVRRGANFGGSLGARQRIGQNGRGRPPQKIWHSRHMRGWEAGRCTIVDVRQPDDTRRISRRDSAAQRGHRQRAPAAFPVLDAEIDLCRSGNRSARRLQSGGAGLHESVDFAASTTGLMRRRQARGAGDQGGTWIFSPDLNGQRWMRHLRGPQADNDQSLGHFWAPASTKCRSWPDARDYADGACNCGHRGGRAGPTRRAGYNLKQVQTRGPGGQKTGADYLHALPSADLLSAKLSAVCRAGDHLCGCAGQLV